MQPNRGPSRRTAALTLAACVSLASAFGGSAAAEVVVRDDRGVQQRFAAPPQRIVSLLPSLTESVCALGGCARLVGTDRFSNAPAQVLALPKLGGLDDTQIERVVALKPDVVLLAPSARVIDRLESLGVKVLVLEARNHADVRRTLVTLAQLLGRPEAATRLWAEIDHEIVAAAQRLPARLRGRRVYYEVDATPYAAGAASFIGETLARLGMANAIPAALGPFPKLNPEFIVRADPQVIFVEQRDAAQLPQRPGWRAIRAVPERRISGYGPGQADVLARPGPRLAQAARLMAQCLQGRFPQAAG